MTFADFPAQESLFRVGGKEKGSSQRWVVLTCAHCPLVYDMVGHVSTVELCMYVFGIGGVSSI